MKNTKTDIQQEMMKTEHYLPPRRGREEIPQSSLRTAGSNTELVTLSELCDRLVWFGRLLVASRPVSLRSASDLPRPLA